MEMLNIYKTRMAPGITEEERQFLVFGELELLEKEVENQSKKTSRWSNVFGGINTILNLVMVLSSTVIVTITSVYDNQKILVIVLGGIILAISSCSQLLKLGPRGFHYRQGTIRLRRIRSQIRDIKYMFHTFTTEQVLTFLSSFRTETDEIDLDLYKTSMTESRYSPEKTDSRIIIASNNSLHNSPYNSHESNDSPNNSLHHSPMILRSNNSPILQRAFPENDSFPQPPISQLPISQPPISQPPISPPISQPPISQPSISIPNPHPIVFQETNAQASISIPKPPPIVFQETNAQNSIELENVPIKKEIKKKNSKKRKENI